MPALLWRLGEAESHAFHCRPTSIRTLPLLAGALALLATSVANATIPANQRQVLLDLYNSTGGANWTDSTGWLGAPGTECTWFGVTCNGGDTAVTDIQLVGNNLAGTLPAISALTSLEYFAAGENSLTGPIPPLTGLISLRHFAVAGNQLTGAIPALTGLTALQEFYVDHNALSGPIPSLSGLSALLGMNVSTNQLSGPLPSLTGLTALQAFIAQQNQLSGAIPVLTGLTNLQLFAVAENSLSGSIPSLTGLASLEHFDVNTNALSGAIPSLAGLAALRNFYAAQNQLTGSIPSLTGLTALEDLSVGENQLTGSIPSFAGLTSLKFFFVYSNQLTGGIPALGGATSLEIIYVGDNPLGGSIPSLSGMTTLAEFSANGAALTGSIPSLAGLASLRNFYVNDNGLTGNIPSLAGLSALEKINVGNNALNGSLPSLSGLGSLIEFFAYTNQFSGPIPSLSGLDSLEFFSVSGNQLDGSIPSLAGLDGLLGLQLDDNLLTGTIPSLADLTSLQQFQVSYNQLSGALPPPPNPSSLEGGLSSLCPNPLTPADDTGWDFATGIGPWWSPCTDEFAFDDAPPLEPGPGSALAGSAVGASPGIVAVGAPESEVGGVASGQVFVYTGTALMPQAASTLQAGFSAKSLAGAVAANLQLPSPQIGDKFGASGVAVSPDGNTIAVGAPGMEADTGGVAVFRKPVGGWTGTIVAAEVLVPVGAAPGDGVGSAVTITNAGTILVGAPGTTVDAATGAGAVYVVREVNDSYSISAPQVSNAPQTDAGFGSSVSGEGSELAIGAPRQDVGGRLDQGRVELFREAAGVYAPLQTIEQATGALGDKFGTAIAVRSGTILVGSPGVARANAADAGEAVFYDQAASGAMSVAATLSQSIPQAGAAFGSSLQLSGDTAIIGAPMADVNGNLDQGVVEVFSAPLGGIFTSATKPIGTLFNADGESGDAYGAAVALSGELAAVGEPFRFIRAAPTARGSRAKGDTGEMASGEAIAYTDTLVFRDGYESERDGVGACFAPNLAIPDNSAGGVNSDVSIVTTGNLRDLDVSVRIAHTQVSDLRLTLTHVGTGKTVPLYIPNATCATDNLEVVFDDQALGGFAREQCSAAPPGVSGQLLPNDWLTIVQGSSRAGPWRLNVADVAAGNTGALQTWCLDAR